MQPYQLTITKIQFLHRPEIVDRSMVKINLNSLSIIYQNTLTIKLSSTPLRYFAFPWTSTCDNDDNL